MLKSSCYILKSLVSLQQGNECQKIWKRDKIVKIEEENYHIFGTTWGISTEFSGKVWFMIKLKTFTPLSEWYILKNLIVEVGG